MIIKSLTIKGFKGFENEYHIDFDENMTIIEGENFQGKTSIGEAICWTLLGCNLFGSDKTANLINKNSSSVYCELEFFDNEDKIHKLIRTKGKESFVILDGKRANVEMLCKYYGDKKIFLSIYNPYYFSSLEPKEQRELLRSILPNIDYKEAFEMLSEYEQKILVGPRVDINSFIKNARDDIKVMDKEKTKLEGQLQYAQIDAATDIGEEKIFSKEYVLQNLEREYENILKSISGDTTEEMTHKLEEIDKMINKYSIELDKLRENFKNTKNIIQSIESDKSVCPVCNNLITDSEKSKEILRLQNKNIEQITSEGKIIEKEISSLKAQRAMLDIKCNSLNPNEKKDEILKKIRDKIASLKLEKDEIQRYNYEVKNNIKLVERANENIKTFEKKINEIEESQKELKEQILVATSLNNLIIKKQIDIVSEFLDKVFIVFSKVDESTGEIKDDYKIYYEGKEFNVLSLSEKIRATLEISNLINKIVELKIPTFIDNSESITHYNKKFDNQIILSKVVKNKELSINNRLELVI